MTNYSTSISELYTRDLNKLKDELNAYTHEANMWKVAPGISNSSGNLALHLIGNLNHFIGAVLGHSGYVRHRDEEFSAKDVPRAKLVSEIEATMKMIETVLGKLTNADLDGTFPIELNGKSHITGPFLIHLFGHLSYHLGQVNYHRRMLDK